MSKQSYKMTVSHSVGNNLIALTHDRNLPFEIQVGEKSEDGDLQLLVTLEEEHTETLNQTLCEIINNSLI